MKIIDTVTVGSRLHGTATPTSDHDRVVIYVEDPIDIAIFGRTKIAQEKDEFGDVSYKEVTTLIQECRSGNPTALEALLASESPDLALFRKNILATVSAERIKNAAAGYALSSMKRGLKQAEQHGIVGATSNKAFNHASRVLDQATRFLETGVYPLKSETHQNYEGYTARAVYGSIEVTLGQFRKKFENASEWPDEPKIWVLTSELRKLYYAESR